MTIDLLTVIGPPLPTGSYVLHLQVVEDLWVRYGRFQQGHPVFTPAGEYVYIGSAMGRPEARPLTRRLLRHASRADGPPHPAQAVLADNFQCSPPVQKKLHWHVDYLLEETAVTIEHITMFSSHLPLETAVAQFLNDQAAFTPLASGLGATDHPGHTHLLRVQPGVDLNSVLRSMTFVSP